jgi:hypothetical protein
VSLGGVGQPSIKILKRGQLGDCGEGSCGEKMGGDCEQEVEVDKIEEPGLLGVEIVETFGDRGGPGV